MSKWVRSFVLFWHGNISFRLNGWLESKNINVPKCCGHLNRNRYFKSSIMSALIFHWFWNIACGSAQGLRMSLQSKSTWTVAALTVKKHKCLSWFCRVEWRWRLEMRTWSLRPDLSHTMVSWHSVLPHWVSPEHIAVFHTHTKSITPISQLVQTDSFATLLCGPGFLFSALF